MVLGDNVAAQKHAESMLEHGFSGHWGIDGLTPPMRYTIAGGINYMKENASGSRGIKGADWERYRKSGWRELLDEAHLGLMNSPGHRRNILYEWHKKVSLGIACNEYTCSVIQNFEGDYTEFTRLPTISDAGVLEFSGRLKDGFVFSGLQVWYHESPHNLTLGQLDASHSYGVGQEPAAFIIKPAPPGSHYSDLNPSLYTWTITTDPYLVSPQILRPPLGMPKMPAFPETIRKHVPLVIADRWRMSGPSFDVKADIREIIDDTGPGVYVVVIWGKNGGEKIPLTNYAIFMNK